MRTNLLHASIFDVETSAEVYTCVDIARTMMIELCKNLMPESTLSSIDIRTNLDCESLFFMFW